ncbi:MAG TPA: hypothetical protein VKE94_20580, partial [Gemmataceae bacterium]|nr:hypothetical protein [Gemmataceae bacterium]
MSNHGSHPNPVQARLHAGFTFAGTLFAFALLLGGNLPAQQTQGKKDRVVEEQDDQPTKKKAPVEEVEDKGAKQKRKVIRVDDDDAPKTPRKQSAADSFAGDLATLAKESKHPGIKKLAAALVRPHDVVGCEYSTSKTRDNKTVEPLAKHYGQKPELTRNLIVIPLSEDWKPLQPVQLAPTVVKTFTPYEELAQERVNEFLGQLRDERWPELPEGSASRLSRREAYAAAYHVLSQVDTWHRAARSRDAREGEGWDKVQDGLQKKLLELRERQLDETLLENDWEAASELARDLGRRYPEKVVHERIGQRLA